MAVTPTYGRLAGLPEARSRRMAESLLRTRDSRRFASLQAISTLYRRFPPTRDGQVLGLILIVGLAVRLVLLAGTASTPLQIADERHYAEIAHNLVSGHGFSLFGRLTSMRPPLLPFLIAGVWRVTGSESYVAVRAVQIGIGMLVVLLTWLLAIRLFNRPTAVVATTIVTLYPSFLFASVLLLTELPFTLLLLAMVWCCDRLTQPKAPVALAVGAGLTLGLAALTRSVLWPFFPLLAAWIFFAVPATRSKKAACSALCLVGYVAVVGPWALRNTRLQHSPTVVDTMGGMNLRMGNYEFTPEDRMWDAVSITGEKNWAAGLGQSHPESRSWTDGQKDKWAQGEAVRYMLANPATTIRRSILKFADFWGLERELVAGFQQGLYRPPTWFIAIAVASVFISYPLVALSASVGIFSAMPRRATHWLVLIISVFIVAVHAVVFGHSRYHLPLVPFLAMYAGYAATEWRARHVPFSRVQIVGTTIACLCLVAVWSHELFFRDAARIRAFLGFGA
jgi:4-amino-4-deoxy-L-arabinose transferase-like glycosyltransferase